MGLHAGPPVGPRRLILGREQGEQRACWLYALSHLFIRVAHFREPGVAESGLWESLYQGPQDNQSGQPQGHEKQAIILLFLWSGEAVSSGVSVHPGTNHGLLPFSPNERIMIRRRLFGSLVGAGPFHGDRPRRSSPAR